MVVKEGCVQVYFGLLVAEGGKYVEHATHRYVGRIQDNLPQLLHLFRVVWDLAQKSQLPANERGYGIVRDVDMLDRVQFQLFDDLEKLLVI